MFDKPLGLLKQFYRDINNSTFLSSSKMLWNRFLTFKISKMCLLVKYMGSYHAVRFWHPRGVLLQTREYDGVILLYSKSVFLIHLDYGDCYKEIAEEISVIFTNLWMKGNVQQTREELSYLDLVKSSTPFSSVKWIHLC